MKTFLIVLSTIGVAYCAMAVSYAIAPPLWLYGRPAGASAGSGKLAHSSSRSSVKEGN